MTHDLDSIDHYVQGDTVVLEYIIEDADSDTDDARKDLTGSTVEWKLKESGSGDVVLSADDADVSADVTDTTNGIIEVTIDAGATSTIRGQFDERLLITDADGNQNTFLSTFYIEPS